MTALRWETEDLEPRLPSPELLARPARVRTADSLDPISAAARSKLRAAPVWRIEHERRSIRLTRPLLVRIYAEEGYVFMQNETLAICGTGRSLEEAMADFSIHVLHFYQYYRSLPEAKVMSEAARLKSLFQSLFVEE